MTPEEFTHKHYRLDHAQISMVTLESAAYLAKSYALHILEEFSEFLLKDYEMIEVGGDIKWRLCGTNQVYDSKEILKRFTNIKIN